MLILNYLKISKKFDFEVHEKKDLQLMFSPVGGPSTRGGGGALNSVEAYNPHTKKICKLTNLTYTVYGHTLCGGLLCGGHLASSLSSSCLKLGPSGFVKTTVSLRENRVHHLCWNVPEGVLLLGGSESPSTTELVLRDGSASISEFELTHPTR